MADLQRSAKMRGVSFIVLALFVCAGCHSVIERQDCIGTYFRVPKVHDEPTGELVLSKDWRYSFLSILPGTIDPATGAPFYFEDFGSWSVEVGAIILRREDGEERRLKVLSPAPQIELEWSPSVRLKKEPNQSSQRNAMDRPFFDFESRSSRG